MSWASPGPAWLFCPADRPERVEKAIALADLAVVDLEDGVAPERRAAARASLATIEAPPGRFVVRLNPVGSLDHALDREALERCGSTVVMLSKSESAADVASLAPLRVVALCETPLGLSRVEEIAAAPNAVAVMWGAEDLAAGLGGTSSRRPDGSLSDVSRYARARTLLAARVAGIVALDTVHVEFDDETGLRAEAVEAASLGFDATPCVHPRQVRIVRDAYRPTPEQLNFARRVLDRWATTGGAIRVDGVMVDGPVVAHARRLLRRAGEATG
ncbi:MAG: HpcH/HpaI aldolase/citrate lyase family protein [Acidimicrobiales bacterium]